MNTKHKLFDAVEVHTNAVLLDEDGVEILLKYPHMRQKLHFTIDAVWRETYAKIKGKDYHGRVVRNVKTFLKEKSSRNCHFPQVVFQFIVQDDNIDEAFSFQRYWHRFCLSLGLDVSTCFYNVPGDGRNYVFFRPLDTTPAKQNDANALYEELAHEFGLQLEENSAFLKNILRRKKHSLCGNICSSPFKTPVIGVDGRVTICVKDNAFKMVVGSLCESSFFDIWWNNGTLHNIRRSLYKGDTEYLKLCHDCIIPESSNYTGIEKKEVEKYFKPH
jgi:hypothetical protein